MWNTMSVNAMTVSVWTPISKLSLYFRTDMIWYDMIWYIPWYHISPHCCRTYPMIWYDMIWYDIYHGTILVQIVAVPILWYDMIWYTAVSFCRCAGPRLLLVHQYCTDITINSQYTDSCIPGVWDVNIYQHPLRDDWGTLLIVSHHLLTGGRSPTLQGK